MKQQYLSYEEQNVVWEKAKAGDQDAVMELIDFMTPFARKIAVQYVSPEVEMEDLMQEAACGVLQAITRYVPCKGAKFSSYCSFWIQKMITEYARRGMIRCPDSQVKWLNKYVAFVHDYLKLNGREPTDEEIIAQLAISRQNLEKIHNRPTSFSVDDIPREAADEDMDYNQVDLHIILKESFKRLTPLERDIVIKKWGLSSRGFMTFKEIGEERGYSKEWARQIDLTALEKIKAYLDEIEFQFSPITA